MYTEESVNKLIQAVEKEFTAHLAKAEEDSSSKLAKSEGESASVDGSTKLAKAEDEKSEKPKHEEEKKEAPKSEEKPAEEKEAPKAEEAPAKEEGKEEGAEEHKEASAEHSEGADEGHGYDDEDLAHMHSMYSSMSHGELKAHHDAVKKCLDGKSEKAAPAMESAPMAKSETVEVKTEKPAVEVELLKSESAAKDAQIADLKKSLDVATEFLNKLFTKKSAPAAKAITSVETIAKSEGGKEEKDLSKNEITAILNKKVADPSLTKSDRDLINAFYLNSGSINSISHLLK